MGRIRGCDCDDWKENFSKTLFHFIKVRPQLKAIVDYRKLFGYLHPINEN